MQHSDTVAVSAAPNRHWLSGLSPASFGIVMATGIVSLACSALGLPAVGRWLFGLNVLLYALVWGLNLARLWRCPRAVRDDACDHGRAPGFFTVVAATGVLGEQCLLLAGAHTAALWLAVVVLGAMLAPGLAAGWQPWLALLLTGVGRTQRLAADRAGIARYPGTGPARPALILPRCITVKT